MTTCPDTLLERLMEHEHLVFLQKGIIGPFTYSNILKIQKLVPLGGSSYSLTLVAPGPVVLPPIPIILQSEEKQDVSFVGDGPAPFAILHFKENPDETINFTYMHIVDNFNIEDGYQAIIRANPATFSCSPP